MVSGVNIFSMMLQGFVLGISTGIYCICACTPVLLPIIIADGKSIGNSFRMVMQYLVGRMSAYTLVGALTIALGQRMTSCTAGRMMAAIALIALAVILMVHALKVNFPQLRICSFQPQTHVLKLLSKASMNIPFIAGFVVGMNACPPVLIAYTFALTTWHVLTSLTFLGSFLAGTALLALPTSFAWLLGKLPSLKGMAQAAILLSALWFASHGIAIIVGR